MESTSKKKLLSFLSTRLDVDTKQLRMLLQPSTSSTISVIILSILIYVVAILTYATKSGLIYRYLFGPNSSAELIKSSHDTVSALNNTVFGNPTLNKVLYFAMWMLLGLIVYIILFSFIRSVSSAAEDIEETTYTNIDPKGGWHAIALRAGIRAAIIVFWLIYWIFFIRILVPFSVLSAKIGVGNMPHATGFIYSLLGIIVLILSLHLHVICMRLIALKVRLFDSADITEAP